MCVRSQSPTDMPRRDRTKDRLAPWWEDTTLRPRGPTWACCPILYHPEQTRPGHPTRGWDPLTGDDPSGKVELDDASTEGRSYHAQGRQEAARKHDGPAAKAIHAHAAKRACGGQRRKWGARASLSCACWDPAWGSIPPQSPCSTPRHQESRGYQVLQLRSHLPMLSKAPWPVEAPHSPSRASSLSWVVCVGLQNRAAVKTPPGLQPMPVWPSGTCCFLAGAPALEGFPPGPLGPPTPGLPACVRLVARMELGEPPGAAAPGMAAPHLSHTTWPAGWRRSTLCHCSRSQTRA